MYAAPDALELHVQNVNERVASQLSTYALLNHI